VAAGVLERHASVAGSSGGPSRAPATGLGRTSLAAVVVVEPDRITPDSRCRRPLSPARPSRAAAAPRRAARRSAPAAASRSGPPAGRASDRAGVRHARTEPRASCARLRAPVPPAPGEEKCPSTSAMSSPPGSPTTPTRPAPRHTPVMLTTLSLALPVARAASACDAHCGRQYALHLRQRQLGCRGHRDRRRRHAGAGRCGLYRPEGNAAAHGATFKNVLKENVFTTDMDALEANDDLRIKFYIDDGSAPPASTWIGCTCLAAPGLMLEIECIAQLD